MADQNGRNPGPEPPQAAGAQRETGSHIYTARDGSIIINPQFSESNARDVRVNANVFYIQVFLAPTQNEVTVKIQDQDRREEVVHVVHRGSRQEDEVPAEDRDPIRDRVPAEDRDLIRDRVPAEDRVPIWDRDPASRASADVTLLSVRKEFIVRMSDPVLNQLIDRLLVHRVITDAEMESLRTNHRADKARGMIDTVRQKGAAASSVLIASLSEVDPCLCRALNLR